jgi:hypothetical protein
VTYNGTGGRHTGGRKLVGREVRWVLIIFSDSNKEQQFGMTVSNSTS